MKKKTIIITALTEAGKTAMQTKGELGRMDKAVNKLFGIKETIISEEPLAVETNFKRVPDPVLEQITIGIYTKFKELGAIQDIDYTLVVK